MSHKENTTEYLDHVDWITLTSVGSSMEASSLEALLRSFDIPVLVKPVGAGGYMEVYMGFTGLGVDIYVPQDDLERASEVVLAYTKNDYIPGDDDADVNDASATTGKPFLESVDGEDSEVAETQRGTSFKWFLRIGIGVVIVLILAGFIINLFSASEPAQQIAPTN